MKFVFTVLLTLCGISQLAAQFNVEGKISDDADGMPVPGAVVSIPTLHLATTTDQNGYYILENLKEGSFQITITHVSYLKHEQSVDIRSSKKLNISLTESTLIAEEVIVRATRAGNKTPITYSEIDKEELEKQNMGQDLPMLLNFTPSMVTTSDAGAGIGYTGLRIRGSDATRINVTINGVPLNDSESQGVFWVDIPDIASSTENVQVQRGVGTSTNGAGAFGGTINLQTNHLQQDSYAQLITGGGSYKTFRNTFGFGTGLIKDHWSIDGRISKITSDGYIDRATSDLNSYYLTAGYYGDKTIVKAIVFGGHERTYQSWYGTPEAVLENDPEGIEEVIANNGLDDEQAENMRTAGRTFNWYLYDDEVDEYNQDHYQLHTSHRFSDVVTGQLTLHYTYGRGFYEQYRRDDDFSDYGLPNIVLPDTTINSTDLVRRRWLDNDFYGLTFGLDINPKNNMEFIFGGGYNIYDGDHFGEIIWTETAMGNVPKDFKYYDNTGTKNDFNVFLKYIQQAGDHLQLFADVQFRNVLYDINGVDSDLRPIDYNETYKFFNPKFGASYSLENNSTLYASFAVGNREPVRTDFIDSPETPKPEHLNNVEVGYRKQGKSVSFEVNGYYMGYKDQLVLTGEVNDVGSSLRTNVPESYRAGLELQAGWKITDRIFWQANATFSKNKIKNFTEVIYDYGQNFDEYNIVENQYEDTDIALSPSIIAASQFSVKVLKGGANNPNQLEFTLLSKFVGDQYLDNTSNQERAIDSYFVNDIRARYSFKGGLFKGIDFTFLVNNVFSTAYSSNGYTFGYQGGPDYIVRENYYYPQAFRNFLVSLSLKI